MDSLRIRCTLLVLVLAICTPSFAQTMTASPSPVTFNYAAGGQAPPAQTITLSPATVGVTAVQFTTNVTCVGSTCSSQSGADVSGLFVANFTQGKNQVNIGFSSVLANIPIGTWNGTINIQATGFSDLQVPLVLTKGNGGTVSVTWQGAAIPSSGVQLNGGIGSVVSTTVVLSSTVTSGFTIGTNVSWLSVSPQAGQVGPAANPQQASITLTGNSSGLQVGANTATVTIAANGTAAAVFTVVFNVGTSSGLTLSTNPMNFTYTINTASFTPGQTQNLTVSGSSTTATLNATSNQSWLLVNGALNVVSWPVSAALPISVNVAALNTQVGSYTGTVVVQTNDNLAATLTVNLTIASTGSGTTGNLNFFVATPGGAAPSPQTFSINGSGSFSAFASTSNCGTGWLQVTPNSGILTSTPTTLTVSVIPGVLGAGTCNGSISISTTGLLQNGSNFQSVSVTMTIGGASTGGTVASPPSLTFNIPQGGSQQQTFIVNGDGTAFNTQSFGVGLSVTPPSGTTPAIVTVTANAASLNVGSAQVGTVTVTSSLGTQSIGVTVNVIAGQVLTTNPASLSYIYQTGNGPVTNVSVNSSADSTGGNLTFSVSSAPAFVSYTATSTTTPTVIGVGINPSKLGPGFNTGAMVLTAGTGAANSTLSVPITVLAPGTTPGLVATPNPVSLTGQAFGGPVTTSLAISGLAGTSFTAATNSSGNWLSVSPTSGLTSPASLTVTASPANLSVNNYQGFVTLTASNGSTLTITVNFAVGTTAPSTPALSVTPTTLTFNYRQGDSAPASQPVQISASGTASNFTVANSVNWISVSQTSGTTPSTLNVSIDTTKVPAGTNSGTLTISATGTTGSPQVVTVTANVTSPPVLSLNASTTSFAYRTGDPNPPNQAVQVSSTGAALNYTVTVSNASWLTVTPTSGSTPATLTLSVSPGTLDVGNYSATVTISATGSTQTLTVTLAVSAPLPTVNEVDNSASNLTGPVAPGEIIVIRGSAMGPETLVTYTLNGDVFATAIGGTRVLVGGFAAPMVYTSSGQVAAIVPYEIAGRTSTFVQVEYLSQRSNAFTVQVAATAPGVYTLNSTGQGPGAILNADYSVNSDANPVPVGGVIQVFATGEGQTIPPGVNGKLADDPILPKPVLPVTATISNIPATVTYMGAAPGLVAGLMQVNIQVPDGAKSGDVVLSIGGVKSQPGVTVSIR